jgi:hypothetical protein
VSRYVGREAGAGDVVVILSSRLGFRSQESERVRELSTGEMLLLRYDETGRLRSLPRLTAQRVMSTCQGEVGPCFDAALRAAGAERYVWVIGRTPLAPALRPWLDNGLERGPVERFRTITVERRQLAR